MLLSNALIIDTSTSMRSYVRKVLQEELDFNEIHEVKVTEDAFRVLKSERVIDWVFSSVEMPGLSALNLLGLARNYPNGIRSRFVLMSSNEESVTRELSIRRGAADYLCKPFSPSQLATVVHRLEGLAEQRSSERFKVATPCEINIGFDSFHQYGAELADISMSGCRMKTSQVKPGSGFVDDFATVTLSLEKGSSFDVQAKIKRVEFDKSCTNPLHNTEVAIEFVDVIPPLKEKLRSFINSCKKKSDSKWQK